MDGGGRIPACVGVLKKSVMAAFLASALSGCIATQGDQSGIFARYGPVGVDSVGQPGKTAQRRTKVVHRVRKGETLYSISRKYRIERAALADYNDISKPYTIRLGQRVRIPDAAYSHPAGAQVLSQWRVWPGGVAFPLGR